MQRLDGFKSGWSYGRWFGWTISLAALIGTFGLARSRAALAVTLPIKLPNYSGSTLLAVDEENWVLVALPILNNGSIDPANGISIGELNLSDNEEFSPDAVAATADGRFAYVHNEGGVDFYRVDLQHIDVGNSHIKEFDFNGIDWTHDGLTVLGSFVYATGMAEPCVAATPVSLYKMAIDPLTGDLGSPTFVADLIDGMNTATGLDGRLTTDGTCIYASNADTDLVFRICGTTVKVWADASTGGDAPGISSFHTIAFGPGNQNLFLSQDNTIFSTTGLSGMTPGSFSQVGTLPGGGTENEGSALFTLGSLKVLFVGNEDEEEIYGSPLTGIGATIAAGAASTFSGEMGSEGGAPGEQVEFDDVEGLAIVQSSPRFSTGPGTGVDLFAGPSAPTPTLSTVGLIGCGLLLLGFGAVSLRRRGTAA